MIQPTLDAHLTYGMNDGYADDVLPVLECGTV